MKKIFVGLFIAVVGLFTFAPSLQGQKKTVQPCSAYNKVVEVYNTSVSKKTCNMFLEEFGYDCVPEEPDESLFRKNFQAEMKMLDFLIQYSDTCRPRDKQKWVMKKIDLLLTINNSEVLCDPFRAYDEAGQFGLAEEQKRIAGMIAQHFVTLYFLGKTDACFGMVDEKLFQKKYKDKAFIWMERFQIGPDQLEREFAVVGLRIAQTAGSRGDYALASQIDAHLLWLKEAKKMDRKTSRLTKFFSYA